MWQVTKLQANIFSRLVFTYQLCGTGVNQLEGLPRKLIQALPAEACAAESRTDSLLAIIRRDQTASVFYNEFYPIIEARIKRKLNAGSPIYSDDFLGIEKVKLDGVAIPAEAGVCYVFSYGWRRGFFFDYGPLLVTDEPRPRQYDLEVAFASCLTRLIFQHLFSIAEECWAELFRQGWFPFIHLKQERIKTLIKRAEAKLPLDGDVLQIRDELLALLNDKMPDWKNDPILGAHFEFTRTAAERLAAADYISTSSILYPRLEGILRSRVQVVAPGSGFGQAQLSKIGAGAEGKAIKEDSLLLPEKFRQFLSDVYFANFDPNKPSGISRNTVSHGVVDASIVNCKAAVVAFLILLQVSTVSRIAVSPKTAKPKEARIGA